MCLAKVRTQRHDLNLWQRRLIKHLDFVNRDVEGKHVPPSRLQFVSVAGVGLGSGGTINWKNVQCLFMFLVFCSVHSRFDSCCICVSSLILALREVCLFLLLKGERFALIRWGFAYWELSSRCYFGIVIQAADESSPYRRFAAHIRSWQPAHDCLSIALHPGMNRMNTLR